MLIVAVMVAKLHTASAVHHHGEEGQYAFNVFQPICCDLPHPLRYPTTRSDTGSDIIVYAASGHGTIVSGPDGSKQQELAPGDSALIPAYAEHQEVNDSDEDVIWIISRGGRTLTVQHLESWSTSG